MFGWGGRCQDAINRMNYFFSNWVEIPHDIPFNFWSNTFVWKGQKKKKKKKCFVIFHPQLIKFGEKEKLLRNISMKKKNVLNFPNEWSSCKGILKDKKGTITSIERVWIRCLSRFDPTLFQSKQFIQLEIAIQFVLKSFMKWASLSVALLS